MIKTICDFCEKEIKEVAYKVEGIDSENHRLITIVGFYHWKCLRKQDIPQG